MDVYDIDPRHPKFETSREPKYKTVSFFGELEDDTEDMHKYFFAAHYYEHDCTIRVVEAFIQSAEEPGLPLISNQEELQNIMRIDIREELNTDYSIIFESKIELK